MKTNFKNLGALTIAFSVALFSCEKNQDLAPTTTNVTLSKGNATTQNWQPEQSLKTDAQEKILAAANENYSLVLGGITGTPHGGAWQSYLVNVDMCGGGPTAWSPITNAAGGANITLVTGITKPAPAVGAFLYGVTGQNSSVPNTLWRINPATGLSTAVANTTRGGAIVSLQDIEYSTVNGRYYAIVEGTNQIVWSVNAINWVNFAVAPTNFKLNGLAIETGAFNRVWVIAGQANFNCAGSFGDMWGYPLGGGAPIVDSYNAPALPTTSPELGLDFYNPVGGCLRNWTVGSANGALTNNMLLCGGGGIPAPIGGGVIKATYDFAKR